MLQNAVIRLICSPILKAQTSLGTYAGSLEKATPAKICRIKVCRVMSLCNLTWRSATPCQEFRHHTWRWSFAVASASSASVHDIYVYVYGRPIIQTVHNTFVYLQRYILDLLYFVVISLIAPHRFIYSSLAWLKLFMNLSSIKWSIMA